MKSLRSLPSGWFLAIAASAAFCAHAPAQVIASSNFDDGPQGWSLPVSSEWRAEGGNPGGFLFGPVDEPTNLTPFVGAPASFLGDWSSLDGVGAIQFDYRRIENGSPINYFVPLTIVLNGGTLAPNSQAVWTGALITAQGPWARYAAPLRASKWVIQSGTWQDILSNVTSVAFQLELVSNGTVDDQNGLDNVALCGSALADFNFDCVVDGTDLGILLGAWGTAEADLNDDAFTDGTDLGILLGQWSN